MIKTIKALRRKTATWFQPKQASVQASPANGLQVLSGDIWLARVVELHNRVRAEMPETQRHFLLPKHPSYFQDLLSGKTGALLGVLVHGELAGFMSVVRLDSFAAAHAQNRITCPDDHGHLAAAYGKGAVAVAQSLCVLNAYMGRSFSRTLVQGAVTWARQQGCPHLFAQVAEHNLMGWIRFMDQDFAIVATWESGHRRFLLSWQAPEERAALLRHPKGQHVYRKDYAQIPALLTELRAKLEHGQTVLLDTRAGEGGAMHFTFVKGLAV